MRQLKDPIDEGTSPRSMDSLNWQVHFMLGCWCSSDQFKESKLKSHDPLWTTPTQFFFFSLFLPVINTHTHTHIYIIHLERGRETEKDGEGQGEEEREMDKSNTGCTYIPLVPQHTPGQVLLQQDGRQQQHQTPDLHLHSTPPQHQAAGHPPTPPKHTCHKTR